MNNNILHPDLIKALNEINRKLDILVAQPGQIVKDADPSLIQTAPAIDPLAHLRAMETIVGLHEVNDRDKLMAKFAEHGIVEDPAVTPWCGIGLRWSVCEAGFADPGPSMHKASNWATYGDPCDPNEPGAILVHHTHVGIRDENGKECGCNVGDSCKIGDDNWFGPIIASRKPVA